MGEQSSSNRASAAPKYIGAKRLPPWELVDLPQLPLLTSKESNNHEQLRSGKKLVGPLQNDRSTYQVRSASQSNKPSYSESEGSTRPLPGTMSSRRVQAKLQECVAKDGQPMRLQKDDVDSSRSSLSPSGRLTSAVRVLFRKDSVDESQLEAIDQWHWAED